MRIIVLDDMMKVPGLAIWAAAALAGQAIAAPIAHEKGVGPVDQGWTSWTVDMVPNAEGRDAAVKREAPVDQAGWTSWTVDMVPNAERDAAVKREAPVDQGQWTSWTVDMAPIAERDAAVRTEAMPPPASHPRSTLDADTADE
jgi:hypothetical protein